MSQNTNDTELEIKVCQHVAIVEMRRPPHNYFDLQFMTCLADAFQALEANTDVRALVLCAQGKAFSAGANLTDPRSIPRSESELSVNPIYAEALRLFAVTKPIVAAVHGAAVGGGLGLALVADFRVTCPEARFSANFARIGITPGFGLTATLPRLIGTQRAAALFYTGRRIGGKEAIDIGLADVLVEQAGVRDHAIALATDIAASSPMAVGAIRAALRAGLVDAVRLAVARESAQQYHQFATADFKEGVSAMAARRAPVFKGVDVSPEFRAFQN